MLFCQFSPFSFFFITASDAWCCSLCTTHTRRWMHCPFGSKVIYLDNCTYYIKICLHLYLFTIVCNRNKISSPHPYNCPIINSMWTIYYRAIVWMPYNNISVFLDNLYPNYAGSVFANAVRARHVNV